MTMIIAEKLKNCPKGTKLYSPIWGEVEFLKINECGNIEIGNGISADILYPDGRYTEMGECVLFPSKKNRDWNKFRVFKHGDFVAFHNESYNGYNIGIFDEYIYDNCCKVLCVTEFPKGCAIIDDEYYIGDGWDSNDARPATSREKLKLLAELNKIGYSWTNERLVKLRFKVHDAIRWKESTFKEKYFITSIGEDRYFLNNGKYLLFENQNEYELSPKFKLGDIITKGKERFCICDISDGYYIENAKYGKYETQNYIAIGDQDDWKLKTFDLKPFDQVLVRNSNDSAWCCSLFSYKHINTFITIENGRYLQCVPYNEETRYLVGTTLECPEYYKTWLKN